ncbi:GNAT family N-acetyltransferase [Kutzneria sp. NPDC052558]|uniref:GNAT family N-acetyltransferase n=1 Tax=Kutzneria sp. NPDC052558 TaxID=3364121 RepID=UPI0037C7556E
MDTAHSVINRVAERHWHALEDDLVVGRGHASPRPDGRIFVSIDAWHEAVFDQLAAAMLADLPTPLHTLVDEADLELRTSWVRAGFTARRRELEYLVPTEIEPETPPAGVAIPPVGAAEEGPLRELHAAIRAEVEATVGWDSMPAEVIHGPVEAFPFDQSKYVVATESGRYVGLVRVAGRRRHARIGLVAVRAEARRRGIGRALLTHMLDSLRHKEIETVSAEVDESNRAAVALFEGLGARRVGSNLELVLRHRAQERDHG